MDKEIITLGDNEIEKRKFDRYRNPMFKDVDTNNKLISKKISSGEETFSFIIWMIVVKVNY